MGSKGRRSVPKLKKAKGKKWKRGQSSSSNPVSKKFREAAKSRFFTISSPNEGSSNLTVDALAKHDEAQTETEDGVGQPALDAKTTSAGTFNTWATNWTECSNVTFSKVHRYWASNSALHKEILAVLAAITEVIKTQGGVESDTEYFAALMTALESTETIESSTAIVYLLSLVLKRVPVPVLQKKFSEVSKQLLDMIAKHVDGENTSLLKSLLSSLASLLRVQEQAVWSNSSTQNVYTVLLTFTTHKKPKVRKTAHQAVHMILKNSIFLAQGEAPPHHPAASLTSKYCMQLIERCGGTGEAVETLHTLALLRDVLSTFPKNCVKSVCETILRVMTVSNVMVTSCGMQALHGLMAAKPKASSLPPELNAQIITALYDYQPAVNDVQPMQAWLVVMEKAHSNLSRLDEKLCLSHLPRLFSAAMTCLLSDKMEVALSATKMMKGLLQQCVAPAADALKMLVTSAPQGAATPIHKVIKAVESGLSYQFHATWGLVLQTLAVLFEVLGEKCPKLMMKCLSSVANLRDSPQFPYRAELDHAVGCAVKTMGPRHVLDAVPLKITGESDDLDFPRSWLIPVIRDNTERTDLSFFTAYFLPLAAKLRQRSAELSNQQNLVAAKTYDTLQRQIWTLLSGFCSHPTDLAQSFKGIAKVLGSAISDRPDLRMSVMSSLRKLITQCLTDEPSRQEVAKFAKNFVPIFFNLYTTQPDKERDAGRLAVLATLKCYLQITDRTLACSFCEKCLEKMNEESVSAFKRQALLDLAVAMVPYVDKDQLRQLYDYITPHLESKDRTLQKKSYRCLEEICAGKSEDCRTLVQETLADIQILLLDALSKSSPSSKAPRLRCLINIFKHLDEEQKDFLIAVLPEAVLCTKEIGERARAAAYLLLVEMGKAAVRWSDMTEKEAFQDYFKLVMAGLAGSPQMISATLLSLTRILYEFKDNVSGPLLESIVENVCALLMAKPREVVMSALGFIKVLLSAYPDTTLACHLKQLMRSLVGMKEDCKHHFRFKSKEIYSKLIKKFGYQTIYGMSPASLHKVLVNIRKTQERVKRQKKEKEEFEDDDETEHFKTRPESIGEILMDTDSEPDEDEKKRSKSNKQKNTSSKHGAAWLKEEGDDQIMDFLDPNASKKVMATKPDDKKPVRSKEGGFKMAPDGRMIIKDGNESDGAGVSDDDDLDELLDAFESGKGKSRKGKKRKVEDLGSDEDIAPPKYKAGGSGIHRPVDKTNKSTKSQVTYGAEYKSKKAGGDVKRKGMPDPYTYVPLNFQSLNKRKRAKNEGQFKNLVKGAKKGAAKGMKAKKKKR